MSRPGAFLHLGVEIDVAARTITCRYRLDDDDFAEVAHLPEGDLTAPGVAAAAEIYALLAGVSYYKTRAPSRIDLGPFTTTPAQAAFLRRYYVAGLGEFALKNDLDLRDIELVGPHADAPPAAGPGDLGRLLIPFGGGLDSTVTVAELADQADDAALFVVERPGARFEAIERPAAATGLPVLRVERQLDPKVLTSAERGYLNGHVPITGVLSALAVVTAAATGRGAVVMSNEHSASSATTDGPFGPVNHQWSKGLEFEQGFRSLVNQRVGAVTYFSWLRDRTELSIAESFASLTEFHHLFRSCNRAFHQDPSRRLDRWCGECDKCLFIDLALAPHMTPDQLSAIFDGDEPLIRPSMRPQLETLLGFGGTRPFECVGDEAECRQALLLAAARPDRAGATELQELASLLPPVPPEPPLVPTASIPDRYAPPARLD